MYFVQIQSLLLIINQSFHKSEIDKKALVKTFQQNTVLLQLVAASLRCLQCNSKNWLKWFYALFIENQDYLLEYLLIFLIWRTLFFKPKDIESALLLSSLSYD